MVWSYIVLFGAFDDGGIVCWPQWILITAIVKATIEGVKTSVITREVKNLRQYNVTAMGASQWSLHIWVAPSNDGQLKQPSFYPYRKCHLYISDVSGS